MENSYHSNQPSKDQEYPLLSIYRVDEPSAYDDV